MKTNIKLSYAFRRLPDNSLTALAVRVHTMLYSKSAYASAPVTAPDLQVAITAFSNAKTAQADGGKLATAEKNQRREELLDLLNKLAYFVQLACDNDLVLLLESGFEAVKREPTPTALTKATILRITQKHTGVALVTAKAERNAKTYEMQAAEVDENGMQGPYGPSVLRSSSLNLPMEGLTAGKMYVFRVRVFGAKGDTSDWSDPQAQRVM